MDHSPSLPILAMWAKRIWPPVQGRVIESKDWLCNGSRYYSEFSSLPSGGLSMIRHEHFFSHAYMAAYPYDYGERVTEQIITPLRDTVEAYRAFMEIE